MKKMQSKTCLFILTLISTGLFAQTRVFKEVNSEIKTELNSIRQDNELVGYLAFSQLEKASADSINYRIIIMDENLNDIGVVNFKELSLNLQGVAFEGDMICLAYTRMPVKLSDPVLKKGEYEAEKERRKKDIGIFFQFISLDGKITKTSIVQEDFLSFANNTSFSKKGVVLTNLRKGVQIQNVHDKGFAVYYGQGHNKTNNLLFFTTEGNKIWQKKLPNFENYILQVASTGIHLLGQPITKVVPLGDSDTEESNEILTYNVENGESEKSMKLRDPKQNDLRVISFRVNSETGRLNVTGYVVNPEKEYYPIIFKDYRKRPYIGLFSIDFEGIEKKQLKTVYSFFNATDKGQVFDEKFRLADTRPKTYPIFNDGFIDDQGNTYFGALQLEQKIRVGNTIASVVLLPLWVVTPVLAATVGYNKYLEGNGQVFKLKQDGTLSPQATIPSTLSKRKPGNEIYLPSKDFTFVKGVSGENYFLFSDPQNVSIYNVNQQKVVRNIPLKDGKESLKIFPAKQGYFMVLQYNSKEKSTTLSIEAL